MKLKDLRSGMDHIDIQVGLVGLEEPREVEANYGVTHDLVEGQVEDDSGKMKLTICDEKIKQIDRVKVGDTVKLKDCMITSLKKPQHQSGSRLGDRALSFHEQLITLECMMYKEET